jgi:hypothetical protein
MDMGDMGGMRGMRDKRPKSSLEMLITGLVIGSVALAYWLFAPGSRGDQWWVLAMAVFAGFLPASRGLAGMISARAQAPAAKKLGERERAAGNERSVLKVARDHGGRLTPALVALDCDMDVAEAEAILDGLAKKGHASMRVREDGRVEYEFSEFMPQGLA